MTLQVKGLSHITFVCKNLEKTAKMFKGIFGAQEIYCSGNKPFSISKEKFLQVCDIWIAIMEGESVDRTYNHIAFRINDEELDEFETRIRSFDLTILPGRKRENAEGRSLYFYDYDNHLFELHTGNLHTRLEYYNEK
ncbi:MAG: FosX/FosE/FosI family fosfomycin resistance hydrolase [Gammaproteobacteria bacterium]|nr:FosX/FosE/FosI family fosfomycin resistance hydrolase [Gammaproteobacteria bacterium]